MTTQVEEENKERVFSYHMIFNSVLNNGGWHIDFRDQSPKPANRYIKYAHV